MNIRIKSLIDNINREYKDATCYYLGYNYGSDRGTIKNGDNISTVFKTGPEESKYADAMRYASEAIEQEELVLDGEKKTFVLAWKPIVPGTLRIEDKAGVFTDDGMGNILKDGAADETSTIDYASGAVSLNTALSGETPTASYSQNLEYAPAQLPLVSMDIKPLFLHAKPKIWVLC